MSRREFPVRVKKAAARRADGRCETVLPSGDRCPTELRTGCYHYDHDVPDGLGGEPTLENCVVRCTACHRFKTSTEDVPRMAAADRQRDRLVLGIKPKRKQIPQPPKHQRPPRDALPIPPRRSVYTEVSS